MLTLISTLVAYIQNRRDEEGQTLVEYGLLLALIAIVVIAVLLILGPAVSAVFQEVTDEL
jgi:pilus assembly protein Flp/PilA